MNTRTGKLLMTWAAMGAGLVCPAVGQSFVGLGVPPGANGSLPRGVSAAGSVVVGQSDGGGNVAWRWTQRGNQSLGWAGFAFAVSDDGIVAVGRQGISDPSVAVRWTGTGLTSLGYLQPGDTRSAAWAVSANGSVAVGDSGRVSPYTFEAFRWTETNGMVGIGYLSAGHNNSRATGVSGDGSTVVGYSGVWGGAQQAFRWKNGVMTGLGFLPGMNTSAASAISADGSTIVGGSAIMGSAVGESFRWTEMGGMKPLGIIPGASSCSAVAVRGDGAMIVDRA